MARVVNLPSHATSCDFHPFLHTLLLGTLLRLLEPFCMQVPIPNSSCIDCNACCAQPERSLGRRFCGHCPTVTACWSFVVIAKFCDRHPSIG